MPRHPELTFVVPTKNSMRTIERCLQSLRSQSGVECEIIVVDNFSTDGTTSVAQRLADELICAGPERSAQRNIGLERATAHVVGFIDSDMYLTPNVSRSALKAFSRGSVDGLIIPERSIGQGFFAQCRALEKDLYVGDPDVESARIFRTDLVRAIGGYREDLRAGEDWDLADRFAGAGHQIGRIDDPILHDDGRVLLRETFRKKQYYGQSFARYLQGGGMNGPRRLSRPGVLAQYRRLDCDPRFGAGLVVLKTVEAAGLAVGVARGWRS